MSPGLSIVLADCYLRPYLRMVKCTDLGYVRIAARCTALAVKEQVTFEDSVFLVFLNMDFKLHLCVFLEAKICYYERVEVTVVSKVKIVKHLRRD
jgi:hypothetical protein